MNPLSKILITGGKGFVGTYLRQELEGLGYEVTRSNFDVREPLQIESELQGKSFDVIFHLAGVHGQIKPEDLYRVNTIGTQFLLDAISKLQPKARVVLQGSSSQYGNGEPSKLITEETRMNPETHYGISRMAADQIGKVYFTDKKLDVVRTRCFNIIGPGQAPTFLCSSVAKKLVMIEKGKVDPVMELGDLSAYRDFIDVRDVAKALVDIGKAGKSGEVYNIASGVAMQATQVVEEAKKLSLLDFEVRTQSLPGINVGYQKGSFEKLKALSGWTPQIAFEESMSDIVKAWRTKI